MKKIEALVRPDCVSTIHQSLLDIGISNMTQLEGKAMGKLNGPTQIYRGVRFQRDYLLHVKLEVFVAEQMANAAVAVMIDAARAGEVREGSVFISNVEEAAGTRVKAVEEPAHSTG